MHSEIMGVVSSLKTFLSFLLLSVWATDVGHGASVNTLPSNFPLCKRSDTNLNECMRAAIEKSVNMLDSGIPSLGVPPLDPLAVDLIEITQGQGPISINMKFTNITVTGLSNSKVFKAEPDFNKYVIPCSGAIEKSTLEANYEMTGRIMLLPVTGKGRSKLVFSNCQADLQLIGKGTMKNGKRFFDVTDFKLDINGLDKLQVQFDNLFNGDKTLGDTMNNLINENWEVLWSELKPAFDLSFGAVFLQYSKTIFNNVAFDDIFLE